jgi:catechol 2,3-dioxygenase-like lactoylglutathione lyase family enzyme
MPVYNHTGLVVSDLDRSKKFYEQVLGFEIWYEDSVPDGAAAKLLGLEPPLGVRVSYLLLDGFVLELMHFDAPGAQAAWKRRTMNEPGLTHLSISVDDIGTTAQQAVERGGEIVEDSDLGIALFIRDPDGQLLELLSMEYAGNRPPRPPARSRDLGVIQ